MALRNLGERVRVEFFVVLVNIVQLAPLRGGEQVLMSITGPEVYQFPVEEPWASPRPFTYCFHRNSLSTHSPPNASIMVASLVWFWKAVTAFFNFRAITMFICHFWGFTYQEEKQASWFASQQSSLFVTALDFEKLLSVWIVFLALTVAFWFSNDPRGPADR